MQLQLTKRDGQDSTPSLALGSAGAASALCGPVVALIAIFDVPADQKLQWSLYLTVAALLFGGSLFAVLRYRGVIVGIALAAALVLNVSLMVLAASQYQETVEARTASCLAPGEGGGANVAAYRNAFAAGGGAEVLGCAISRVKELAGGTHQNFVGPDGPALIVSARQGQAVHLTPADWAAYHSIRGPVDTTIEAGFPYGPSQSLADGRILEVGDGPGRWERSGVINHRGGPWFWVQAGMWACYMNNFGGPDGSLGYPTSDQQYDQGRRLPYQTFERGILYFDSVRGAITSDEIDTSRFTSCAGPTQAPIVEIYQVKHAGGVPHEILPDGYVDQQFTATATTVYEVGAVVGLDPNSDSGVSHDLEFEIRDGESTILKQLASLQNNTLTTAPGASTQLVSGRQYVLRVINASPDTLGFYLDSSVGSANIGSEGCRALLVKEKPDPAPHYSENCLAGHVRGR